mmetsp:Transcript_14541/g.21445  ORF Transcript_14541/g.21445 Transcript_14541/m.21445 type:complete len:125 (-) Transcript_14541:54-428(-)|eukprot:CAMPEP_0194201930 /NCGR_PEP_ID=MMETSP0156-20130528/2079_1 /TAXON_ID=33649 /ORGANISM="Thalassionema nitzschioides, Strain L26-B" /LENGTH=124 /DNA_ID=CAMNT_0038927263 /DNA_START=15 /DNA_END=389 /DNA_ORIENTATION=-
MASRLLLRRSVARASSSSIQRGGASPPLPPFQRLPTPSQPLVENHDIIFDDGVAPELALDFDCPHISSGEAVTTWAGALTGVFLFYQWVKSTDPEGQNPAVNRKVNLVHPVPKKGKEFFEKVEL